MNFYEEYEKKHGSVEPTLIKDILSVVERKVSEGYKLPYVFTVENLLGEDTRLLSAHLSSLGIVATSSSFAGKVEVTVVKFLPKRPKLIDLTPSEAWDKPKWWDKFKI